MKATYKNILIYILVKYFLFYSLLMFKNKNYALLKLFEMKNFQDFIYYFIIFLSMPTIYCILFLFPLRYSFQQKSASYFLLIVILIFIFEYTLYTFLASTTDLLNGVINMIVGLVLFILMFYKEIKRKFGSISD